MSKAKVLLVWAGTQHQKGLWPSLLLWRGIYHKYEWKQEHHQKKPIRFARISHSPAIDVQLYTYITGCVLKLQTSLGNMRQDHAFQWGQSYTSAILGPKISPVVQSSLLQSSDCRQTRWMASKRVGMHACEWECLWVRIHCSFSHQPTSVLLTVSYKWEFSR